MRKLASLSLLAFALAAMAPVAHASTFTAEKYPAKITGTVTLAHKLTLEKGLAVTCAQVAFSGILPEASSTMTITPQYAECSTSWGVAATVSMSGCDYLFHAGKEVATDVHTGTVDVVCPTGKSIVITAGTCEVSIPTQAGIGPSEIENNTNPLDATAGGTLSGIEYVKKDGFLCPLEGSGTKSDGVYTGETTGTGEDPETGTPIGISIDA